MWKFSNSINKVVLRENATWRKNHCMRNWLQKKVVDTNFFNLLLNYLLCHPFWLQQYDNFTLKLWVGGRGTKGSITEVKNFFLFPGWSFLFDSLLQQYRKMLFLYVVKCCFKVKFKKLIKNRKRKKVFIFTKKKKTIKIFTIHWAKIFKV